MYHNRYIAIHFTEKEGKEDAVLKSKLILIGLLTVLVSLVSCDLSHATVPPQPFHAADSTMERQIDQVNDLSPPIDKDVLGHAKKTIASIGINPSMMNMGQTAEITNALTDEVQACSPAGQGSAVSMARTSAVEMDNFGFTEIGWPTNQMSPLIDAGTCNLEVKPPAFTKPRHSTVYSEGQANNANHETAQSSARATSQLGTYDLRIEFAYPVGGLIDATSDYRYPTTFAELSDWQPAVTYDAFIEWAVVQPTYSDQQVNNPFNRAYHYNVVVNNIDPPDIWQRAIGKNSAANSFGYILDPWSSPRTENRQSAIGKTELIDAVSRQTDVVLHVGSQRNRIEMSIVTKTRILEMLGSDDSPKFAGGKSDGSPNIAIYNVSGHKNSGSGDGPMCDGGGSEWQIV